jgi:hypothetical protein
MMPREVVSLRRKPSLLRRLVTAGVVLLALVAMMGIAGSFVAREHESIVAAEFPERPEQIWPRVADIPQWPTWNKLVRRVEPLPSEDGRPTWLVVDRSGSFPTAVIESTPPGPNAPGTLITRIAGPKLPFSGTWIWEVAPVEGGSRVTIAERGEVGSPVFRFLSRFVLGYTSTAELYLIHLAQGFGHDVSIEVVRKR